MSEPVANVAVLGMTIAAVSSRYGIKGASAGQWLAQRGIAVPAGANSVTRWDRGRCLRLGYTEFLVETDGPAPDADMAPASQGTQAGPGAQDLRVNETGALAGDPEGPWLLLRSDHCIVLSNSLWPAALAQACSFDFNRLREEPDLVVMTLFAGIAITVIRESAATTDYALRLWCDPTYATYLHDSLQQLAANIPSGEKR